MALSFAYICVMKNALHPIENVCFAYHLSVTALYQRSDGCKKIVFVSNCNSFDLAIWHSKKNIYMNI